MFRSSLVTCLASLVWSFAAGVAPAEIPPTAAPAEPEGMEQLFNGTDLAGWDGDPRLWSVRDGVIHGETTADTPAAGNTFLIWKGGEVGDFELRLSFRCNATNNSGIQYRSQRVTDEPVGNEWVVRGYQHEVRNQHLLPDVPGFVYDERSGAGGRGRMCEVGERAVWKPEGKQVTDTLIDQRAFSELMRLDDWNDVVIVARGNHIRHYLNGRLILDFIDEHPKALSRGLIALQLHGGAPMWAEFKDIRLERL